MTGGRKPPSAGDCRPAVRSRRIRVRPARRRPWLLAGLAVAALALGGYVAFRLLTRESSTPASVAAALARLRAQPPTARTLPPALRGRAPQPGVYVYATSGFEVSHALGTRRHAYPARTTMTVSTTPAGCLRLRWDVLATRDDAVLACRRADGSWRLAAQSESHAFAGHLDRRTYACTPASTYLPAILKPGATWSSRCAIPGTTTSDSGVVLGPRTLTLDGRPTRTVLLRTTTRVRGETVGAGTTFTWLLPDTRLVVRRMLANASATATIIGSVPYEERASLALDAPRPRR
ncbi:MAG TPA: hypothetical protein VFU94_04985 [Conexibacter sp.]|nr:hypothetical protein [Conexibacter sp.]